MDERIQKIMEEKIHESSGRRNEITSLVNSLGQAKNPNVFWTRDNNWKIV